MYQVEHRQFFHTFLITRWRPYVQATGSLQSLWVIITLSYCTMGNIFLHGEKIAIFCLHFQYGWDFMCLGRLGIEHFHTIYYKVVAVGSSFYWRYGHRPYTRDRFHHIWLLSPRNNVTLDVYFLGLGCVDIQCYPAVTQHFDWLERVVRGRRTLPLCCHRHYAANTKKCC